LTHVIIISSIDGHGGVSGKPKKDYQPAKIFKSQLISALSRVLPSVGLSSNFIGLFDSITLLSDYVGRKLPLVLIDCRSLPTTEPDPVVLKRVISRQTSMMAGPPPPQSSVDDDESSLEDEFYDWAKRSLDAIDKSLGERSWNFYQIATLSFLHSVLQQYTKGGSSHTFNLSPIYIFSTYL
jgi:hypothetical protein